jgi:hypothetical protein
MNNLSVMEFSYPSQTIPEDAVSGSHWDLLPTKAKEVVRQIFIHEYALSWYGVARQSYVGTLVKLGPDLLIEAG